MKSVGAFCFVITLFTVFVDKTLADRCAGKPNGDYCYPNDPNQIMKCYGEQERPIKCPADLEFNCDLDRCEYMNTTGNCNGPEMRLCHEDKHHVDPSTSRCVGKPNGDYCYPDEPKKVMKCFDGYEGPVTCPSNLEFNCDSDRCEYPNTKGNCNGPEMRLCREDK